MNQVVVSDKLWAIIAPLLPPERPKLKGGRPRVAARAVLTSIIFVLKSGIPREMLPHEIPGDGRPGVWGSGMTCWRRLRDWLQPSGVNGTLPLPRPSLLGRRPSPRRLARPALR